MKTIPLRVTDGFGRAVHAATQFQTPRSIDELAAMLMQAKQHGAAVTFRGAGRSYGDASLNSDGVTIDMTQLDRVIDWNPHAGTITAEPGVTIEDLWRRTIEDGFWPYVVPGTMRPTLGGCLSMNIHGKNNFKAGTFGEYVEELELLTAEGERVTCSRSENADLFHAVIGGLGLLGAITKVKLRLKKIESGNLRVTPLHASNLDAMFDIFESRLSTSDYLVGWVDCLSSGDALGRGEVHAANYLSSQEDPTGKELLRVDKQGLPSSILGFPKSQLWRVMQYFMNDPGVSLVNSAKYFATRYLPKRPYLQSHVAFAFLLDYVPNWRLSYGLGGFIQYQVFVPHSTARECLHDVLRLCHREGIYSYLGVLKRHRPDPFLLTHGLDGWSLAMDFKADDKPRLWKFTEQLTARVLEAGGKFYFAKDAVLKPGDVKRAYGEEKISQFIDLRDRVDPDHRLSSDLWRRIS